MDHYCPKMRRLEGRPGRSMHACLSERGPKKERDNPKPHAIEVEGLVARPVSRRIIMHVRPVIPRPPPGHGRAAHRIKTPCPALPQVAHCVRMPHVNQQCSFRHLLSRAVITCPVSMRLITLLGVGRSHLPSRATTSPGQAVAWTTSAICDRDLF
jgi:hypothetical protein